MDEECSRSYEFDVWTTQSDRNVGSVCYLESAISFEANMASQTNDCEEAVARRGGLTKPSSGLQGKFVSIDRMRTTYDDTDGDD